MSREHYRFPRQYRPPPASPPGTLRSTPHSKVPTVTCRVLRYNEAGIEESTFTEWPPEGIAPGDGGVLWVDVQGLHDVTVLGALARSFGLHRLTLETAQSPSQRPKVDAYRDQLVIVARRPARENGVVVTEPVTVVLTPSAVITLHDLEGDSFAPIRARIRVDGATIRLSGADYLAYAVIDALIDEFFPVLEDLGERLDELERQLFDEPNPQLAREIRREKDQLLVIRRGAWPAREVISALVRDESGLVSAETKVYLRDCYDHAVEVVDIVEMYREVAGGLTDLYLSSLSHQMNEIMKVLTLMATIFIPLTFIAGIYGMNFDYGAGPLNMPELHNPWGYPLVMGLMLVIAAGMLWAFRRKGWL